jgi:hypothetical protein
MGKHHKSKRSDYGSRQASYLSKPSFHSHQTGSMYGSHVGAYDHKAQAVASQHGPARPPTDAYRESDHTHRGKDVQDHDQTIAHFRNDRAEFEGQEGVAAMSKRAHIAALMTQVSTSVETPEQYKRFLLSSGLAAEGWVTDYQHTIDEMATFHNTRTGEVAVAFRGSSMMSREGNDSGKTIGKIVGTLMPIVGLIGLLQGSKEKREEFFGKVGTTTEDWALQNGLGNYMGFRDLVTHVNDGLHLHIRLPQTAHLEQNMSSIIGTYGMDAITTSAGWSRGGYEAAFWTQRFNLPNAETYTFNAPWSGENVTKAGAVIHNFVTDQDEVSQLMEHGEQTVTLNLGAQNVGAAHMMGSLTGAKVELDGTITKDTSLAVPTYEMHELGMKTKRAADWIFRAAIGEEAAPFRMLIKSASAAIEVVDILGDTNSRHSAGPKTPGATGLLNVPGLDWEEMPGGVRKPKFNWDQWEMDFDRKLEEIQKVGDRLGAAGVETLKWAVFDVLEIPDDSLEDVTGMSLSEMAGHAKKLMRAVATLKQNPEQAHEYIHGDQMLSEVLTPVWMKEHNFPTPKSPFEQAALEEKRKKEAEDEASRKAALNAALREQTRPNRSTQKILHGKEMDQWWTENMLTLEQRKAKILKEQQEAIAAKGWDSWATPSNDWSDANVVFGSPEQVAAAAQQDATWNSWATPSQAETATVNPAYAGRTFGVQRLGPPGESP